MAWNEVFKTDRVEVYVDQSGNTRYRVDGKFASRATAQRANEESTGATFFSSRPERMTDPELTELAERLETDVPFGQGAYIPLGDLEGVARERRAEGNRFYGFLIKQREMGYSDEQAARRYLRFREQINDVDLSAEAEAELRAEYGVEGS